MKLNKIILLLLTTIVIAFTSGCKLKNTTTLVAAHAVDPLPGDSLDPYFAVIKFQTTIGVPGSTRAEFVDQRATLMRNNIKPSDGWVPINDSAYAKRTTFVMDYVTPEEIAQKGMTITGMMIFGLESDKRGWDPFRNRGIRGMLHDIANDFERQLAVFESASWHPVHLKILQNRIKSFFATAPRNLGGNSGRDDLIGVHTVLNIGAAAGYYSQMRPLLDRLGVADCDGQTELTTPQTGNASYFLSVCGSRGEVEGIRFFKFSTGNTPGHTNYYLLAHQKATTFRPLRPE